MLKRITSILLALTITCTLLMGCNGNKDVGEKSTESQKTESVENDKQDRETTEAVPGIDWEIKDLPAITIPETIVEEVSIHEGSSTKVKLATTPFTVDLKAMKDKLAQNEFMKSNYVLAQIRYEMMSGETYTDIGDVASFEYTDTIGGCYINECNETERWFNDFNLDLNGDTSTYKNYEEIWVEFNDITFNKETQDGIYSVMLDILEGILDEKSIESLVYAKDPDGNNYNDKKLQNKEDYGELINVGDVTYRVTRYLSYDKDEPNESNIRLTVAVEDLGYYNRYEYYSSPETFTSYYDASKLEAIFGDRLGNLDMAQLGKFADTYMQLGNGEYVRTLLTDKDVDVRRVIGDNGVTGYEVNIEAMRGCSDVSKLISPELIIDLEIYENENGIIHFNLTAEGAPGCDPNSEKEVAYEHMHGIMIQQLQLLLGPSVDLSGLTFEAMEKSDESNTWTQKYTSVGEFFGMRKNVNINLKTGRNMADAWTGSFSISLSDIKSE